MHPDHSVSCTSLIPKTPQEYLFAAFFMAKKTNSRVTQADLKIRGQKEKGLSQPNRATRRTAPIPSLRSLEKWA